MCWNRRSRRPRHKVEKPYEYRQGNCGSIVEPERPGRDCQGKGEEDGGRKKGLLCWAGVSQWRWVSLCTLPYIVEYSAAPCPASFGPIEGFRADLITRGGEGVRCHGTATVAVDFWLNNCVVACGIETCI